MMNEKIKTDKDTRTRMIRLLRMEMAKNVNDGVRHWLKDRLDSEMWEMVVTDTNDLIDVIDLIGMGAVSSAFERASNLDTAVRDIIPTEVWNWMSKVRQDELKTA